MTHTLRQMIQCITLSCVGAIPAIAEPATPPTKTGLGAGVAQVRESVAEIYRNHNQIRQRIHRLETMLFALERECEVVGSNNYRHLPKTPNRVAAIQAAIHTPIHTPIASNSTSKPIDSMPSIQLQTNQLQTGQLQAGAAVDTDITYDNASLDGVLAINDGAFNNLAIDNRAINDDALNEMRGGFFTGNGLQISFGIERAVYINGNLVTFTSLNIIDLTKLVAVLVRPIRLGTAIPVGDVAAALATTEAVSQTSLPLTAAPNNSAVITQPSATVSQQAITSSTSTPTPANAETNIHTAGAASLSLPETLSSQTTSSQITSAQTTTASTTSAAIVQSSNSAIGSLALIQSGDGNSLPTKIVDPSAISTIIQNSLDNQKIQTVTVVNASVNSLEVLKTHNLQSDITASVANSLKR